MFKLICALGNSDIANVKALVKLYAKAGAWMFDVSPYALEALNEAIVDEGLNPDNFKYCISIPVQGDVHSYKAAIDPKKCKICKKCHKCCPQDAICAPNIDEKKCIGCALCVKKCSHNAIKMYGKNDYLKEFKKLVKSGLKLDCVELHASVDNEKLIIETLKKICKKFKGSISVCLSRKVFSTNKAFELLNKMKEIAKDNSDFFVQADGKSMNGADAQIASSIECVAFALALRDCGFDEKKIILSGGVNEHTQGLCRQFSLNPLALAYGTYARKAVKDLDPKCALTRAKELVSGAKWII